MKVHILSDKSIRLISIYELHTKNGLYDLLVVIRDKCGVYAYRTELFSRVSEFIEASSCNETKENILIKETEPDFDRKIEKRTDELIGDIPISNIVLSPEDQIVFFNIS